MQEEPTQEQFIEFFKNDDLRTRLQALQTEGKTSVGVKFEEIVTWNSELAQKLVDDPKVYVPFLMHGAYEQLRIEDQEYASTIETLHVRVYDLFHTTTLRDIGSDQIGRLIMLRGIVIKASVVKPRVTKAVFECRRCSQQMTVEQPKQNNLFMRTPLICENPECEKKGPFDLVTEESEYINEQEIWIQESPEELPPGQMPRSLQLKLVSELCMTAMPGDNVSVVGTLHSMPRKVKGGTLGVFDVYIEVNSIKTLGKDPVDIPDPQDLSRIQELAKDPLVHIQIVASIAPSIHGYDVIKEAITYILFGGVAKEREDIKVRGEINCLLVGDPGTAKSQILRYVAHLAPRGLFTSGKGTTGVGLTAAVVKDKDSGEYTLEAGALVLADKGIACIDEMDKMNEGDRETIHETLEQHTVSIAKGGIVATLNARTAVLAAANPVLGRYNPFKSIVENISLPVTLLSRFDLIFLMRDIPNQAKDTELSKHILDIHAGTEHTPPIDSRLLKKYISYSKQLKPLLTSEASERIQQFYLTMRKSSETPGSPIAIGPRQLEALTRISEASARQHLREQVIVADAEAAIKIMTESVNEVGIDLTSGKPDIDILLTGKPKGQRDKLGSIINLVMDMSKDAGIVEKDAVVTEAGNKYSINASDAYKLIETLLREGTIYEHKQGWLKKT